MKRALKTRANGTDQDQQRQPASVKRIVLLLLSLIACHPKSHGKLVKSYAMHTVALYVRHIIAFLGLYCHKCCHSPDSRRNAINFQRVQQPLDLALLQRCLLLA